MIQVQRQDFNGRMITIRAEDLRAIACLFGVTPDAMSRRLDELGPPSDRLTSRRCRRLPTGMVRGRGGAWPLAGGSERADQLDEHERGCRAPRCDPS